MRVIKVVAVTFLTVLLAHSKASLRAETAPPGRPSVDLGLSDLLHRVLERNENLQVKLLDFEAARHKYLSEHGAFEPVAFANANRQVDNRQNTSIQAGALLGQPFYHATNTTYEGGLETLVPLGTRVRLGYTVTDIHDSLQPVSGLTNGEYQTFIGFNITQPLLKNFGPAVSLVAIRVAALSSKIAFQEYRRQLMTIISTAEATYWNLYLAQEQVRYFEESVKTAEIIVKDNRTRLEAGNGSQLDVLEAESGLALRQAKLIETRQKMIEAANQVISLYAAAPNPENVPVRAIDAPRVRSQQPHYEELQRAALEWNPDYLIQEQKEQQELVRLGFARNQRLPQLDFKGGYGINGLGATAAQSWDNGMHNSFASWSLGLEFRLPLGGDIRARNEFSAAQLQVKSAEMATQALGTQIATAIDTAWHKLEGARNSIENYQTTVRYNQTLLDSALARLQEGKLESGKVLDVEAALLEAKDSAAESLVHYEVALLELEVIEGALLQDRHLEITQESLQAATRQFVDSGRLTEEQYRRGLAATQRLYQNSETWKGDPIVLRHLGQLEREKVEELKTAGQTNRNSSALPAKSPDRPTNSP
jgi:outer membrane protein TolC